jgi:hypothetical protein
VWIKPVEAEIEGLGKGEKTYSLWVKNEQNPACFKNRVFCARGP